MEEKLINKNVDWNNYKTTFPERYLKESRLDFELHNIISDILINKKCVKILDVGGGPNLTPALNRLFSDDKVLIELLDPYCIVNPNLGNNIQQTSWDYIKRNVAPQGKYSHEPYDLIVLRGSINYLTLEEINTIYNCIACNGILIANSFAEPKAMDRICYNKEENVDIIVNMIKEKLGIV